MSNMIDRNVANGAPAILSRRRAWLAATGFVALLACASTSPATAATCQFVGGPQFGGSEPPLAIDAICTDPDYNATTFVIDSTQQQTLTLPDGTTIPYTEVKGHFPVLKKPTELPPGITHSPTTASHSVFWRFPDKKYWHNRFLQQTYPLPIDILNTVDNHFAFTNGGYTVGVSSGSPTAGYRVIAAAAKLAKEYANKLYGNTGRVYGYLFGASGGSVQCAQVVSGSRSGGGNHQSRACSRRPKVPSDDGRTIRQHGPSRALSGRRDDQQAHRRTRQDLRDRICRRAPRELERPLLDARRRRP